MAGWGKRGKRKERMETRDIKVKIEGADEMADVLSSVSLKRRYVYAPYVAFAALLVAMAALVVAVIA